MTLHKTKRIMTSVSTDSTTNGVVGKGHSTRKFKVVQQNNIKKINSKEKRKVVAKTDTTTTEPEYREFRLFDFQAYDHRELNSEGNCINTCFMIRMFGINEQGETCAIMVDDYKPFFYIQVDAKFAAQSNNAIDELLNYYRTHDEFPKYLSKDIISAKLETRQKLYEFTGNTSFHFVKFTFRTTRTFRRLKGIIQKENNTKRYLDREYPLYESNIPPLLRYFHINNISPSGWIRIKHSEILPCTYQTSTCTYEYLCKVKHVHPLVSKETPVPYKIASFDIEASSSHGDFPLPVKDYKRLATQFIDLLIAKKSKQPTMTVSAVQMLLKKSIKTAFEYDNIQNIDPVYPKYKKTKDEITEACKLILETKIKDETVQKQNSSLSKAVEFFERKKEEASSAAAGGGGSGDGDGESNQNGSSNGTGSGYAEELASGKTDKKAKVVYSEKDQRKTIAEYLAESDHSREERIQTLNNLFSNLVERAKLPPLQGDEITFIGTTFIKNGQVEPYKHNCIVVGSCTSVEGVEIQTTPDEKQCILDWSDLIQSEDPDIIIGYNIFGFDYQFMFQRAKELDIVEDFCNLSRIKGEICAKTDYETKEYKLDHTQNRLASGDYDLHYPCISGRLQIDLLFYFRRDYNLSSYKLDDVAGTMIKDGIKAIEPLNNGTSRLYSKNLAGLHVDAFIHLEITSFTTDYYAGGRKFKVLNIEKNVAIDQEIIDRFESNGLVPPASTTQYNVITIDGHHHEHLNTTKQSIKWGMAKDDVSPQDIFRLSKESAKSRSIVAKYCIQDCNLVHHLMKKVDVLTGYNEMSRICNVPISFLVFRGQGIKLTSYVAKVCREKDTLMPDLEKTKNDDGYEGAIVLPPKCAMYGENPVACVDYSSLYPSIAKGWNLSPNSKVWTKTFDNDGKLVKINQVTITDSNLAKLQAWADRYDNLPDYKYINVTFDNFEQIQRFGSTGNYLKTDKIKSGYKEVRWAKFPDKQEGIIPCIIGDLLKARKETRKKAESEPDPFLANVLDKRQLGYKVTANSLYGQMGSSVSTFFEKDVAASITSIGRQMITYAKRMVEEIYGDSLYHVKSKNNEVVKIVRTRSTYVYGDTDSVFFTFNLENPETGAPIRGKEALELTIEIAQEAADLCSLFLPPPMKLAYEKTLMSFILLSKKRYVGMLYELNPNKGNLKFMGLPLKRRDACDYLKDVYGGILTILMKEPDNIQKAIEFLNLSLQNLIGKKVSIEKLALTKSLRSYYKNPQQIAHRVLADRIGEREPGNKPKPGDRIQYAFIENQGQKLLGDRIETLEYIAKNKLELDYHYYITNQLMNPLLQLFSLALEKVYLYKNFKQRQIVELNTILNRYYKECDGMIEPYMKKREKYCSAEVKKLLFDPFLTKIYHEQHNKQHGLQSLLKFYKKQ